MELKELKNSDLSNQLATIMTEMTNYVEQGLALHEVESQLFKSVLQLGKCLLEAYLVLSNEKVSRSGPLDLGCGSMLGQ